MQALVSMALIGTVLSLAGCGSRLPQEGPPAQRLSEVDATAIRELALRQAFKDVIHRNEASYCVSLEKADPGPDLLQRFEGARPSVVPASKCRGLRNRPEDAQGQAAIVFWLSPVQAVADNQATVEVGWNTGNSLAGDASFEYRMSREPVGWRLSGRNAANHRS